jgi:hypothetical protein
MAPERQPKRTFVFQNEREDKLIDTILTIAAEEQGRSRSLIMANAVKDQYLSKDQWFRCRAENLLLNEESVAECVEMVCETVMALQITEPQKVLKVSEPLFSFLRNELAPIEDAGSTYEQLPLTKQYPLPETVNEAFQEIRERGPVLPLNVIQVFYNWVREGSGKYGYRFDYLGKFYRLADKEGLMKSDYEDRKRRLWKAILEMAKLKEG